MAGGAGAGVVGGGRGAGAEVAGDAAGGPGRGGRRGRREGAGGQPRAEAREDASRAGEAEAGRGERDRPGAAGPALEALARLFVSSLGELERALPLQIAGLDPGQVEKVVKDRVRSIREQLAGRQVIELDSIEQAVRAQAQPKARGRPPFAVSGDGLDLESTECRQPFGRDARARKDSRSNTYDEFTIRRFPTPTRDALTKSWPAGASPGMPCRTPPRLLLTRELPVRAGHDGQ